MMSRYGIKIYLDSADLDVMRDVDKKHPGVIEGFTTNPTLMRAAGVRDYAAFARDALKLAAGRPVSFEVIADDLDTMLKQGRKIAGWGDNACVKIPVTTTDGSPTGRVYNKLITEGARVNVTAVFTVEQVQQVMSGFGKKSPLGIISVFAGRVANAGVDPREHIQRCKGKLRSLRCEAELLWASPRQVYDVFHSSRAGADIITLTPPLIEQLDLLGTDLEEYSLQTVQMFYRDAVKSRLKL